MMADKSSKNFDSKPKCGSSQQVSTDSAEVKHYAELGLRKLSSIYGGANELIMTEIISATHQVVAGSLHKIRVKYGESNCLKGKADETFSLAENSPIKECLITAWSRPWIKENPLEIEVKCD
ncbi:cystatin-like protein [Microplitis demolitor]|uniref:cystatin-like protein n=1 Tax=Microplitis demolitor TaxID=69319 RepID=UPI0004CCED0E|nr:cystatin-like protein [Microplitis demolitor]